MPNTDELYALKITCPTAHEAAIEEAFADEALAVSSLLTDEEDTHILEIIVPYAPHAEEIAKRLKGLPFDIVPLGNMDWIKEVAGNFEPLDIARWTVFGAAFKDQVPPSRLGLQIDATSAFGTGEHPTTRGCLIALDGLLSRSNDAAQWRMLDIGCGSGILAMAFAKATGGQALGVDMEEDSVRIAQENCTINRLNPLVEIVCGKGYAPQAVSAHKPYSLIMANVFADPLCEMAADLAHHLAKGGNAILSGILNDQAERVIAAHRQQGLELINQMTFGEWSVLELRG